MAIDDQDAKIIGKTIADEIQKILKIPTSGRTATKLSINAAEYSRAVDKQISEMLKLARAQGMSIKQLDGFAGSVRRTTDVIGKNYRAYTTIGSALNKAEQTIKSFADANRQGADDVKTFFNFKGPIGDLAGSFDFNIKIFRQLSSQGADFGKSLVDLRQAAADARLPLLEFVDLTAKNAETLAALFGTVNSGIPSLTAFTEKLRLEGIPQLAELGITTENLNEFLGTYLQIQRFQNNFERLTQKQIIDGTIAYSRELDKLSKLTGVQREMMDESIRRQQQDSVFQAYLTDLRNRGLNEQADQAQLFVGALDNIDRALADNVKNYLSTGIITGDFNQKLASLGEGFVGTIRDFRAGGLNSAEALSGLIQAAKNFRATISDPAVLLMGDLKEVGDSVLKLSSYNIDLGKATLEQRAQANALTKSLAEFNEAAKRLKGGFESLQTSILSGLGPFLSGFVNGTNKAFASIGNALSQFSREFPTVMASMLITGLAGKYLFNYATQIAIIAAGVRLGQRGLAGFFGNMGGFFKNFSFQAMFTNLRTIAGTMLKVVGFLATAVTMLSSLFQVFNPATRGAGMGGLIGGAIGFALGGPIGAAVGATLGNFLGGQYDKASQQVKQMEGNVPNRHIGTQGRTGFPSEPKSTLAFIQKGEVVSTAPELAAMKSTGDANFTSVSNSLNQFTTKMGDGMYNLNRSMDNVVNTLERLVAVSAQTANNTGKTARNLQEGSMLT